MELNSRRNCEHNKHINGNVEKQFILEHCKLFTNFALQIFKIRMACRVFFREKKRCRAACKWLNNFSLTTKQNQTTTKHIRIEIWMAETWNRMAKPFWCHFISGWDRKISKKREKKTTYASECAQISRKKRRKTHSLNDIKKWKA